jgi:hypothetical protein
MKAERGRPDGRSLYHCPLVFPYAAVLNEHSVRNAASEPFVASARNVHDSGYERLNIIRRGQIRWLAKPDTVGEMRFIEGIWHSGLRSLLNHRAEAVTDSRTPIFGTLPPGFHCRLRSRRRSAAFENVKFIDLFNDWWKHHGSKTRSKFQYRTPRVLARFGKKKAREITPEAVRDFLGDLRKEGLAASSINQCRTILCSVFNYAIRFEKYDKNPVSVVAQEKEPPGRDRFPEPEEIVSMIRVCEEKGDLELKAFLILAPTTGMRKCEILARKWTDIDLDSRNPSINVRLTKNDEPKRIQLPEIAVEALRALPSYGHHEYFFPAKANPRFQGNFRKPYA